MAGTWLMYLAGFRASVIQRKNVGVRFFFVVILFIYLVQKNAIKEKWTKLSFGYSFKGKPNEL
jgi:hypothetical protein